MKPYGMFAVIASLSSIGHAGIDLSSENMNLNISAMIDTGISSTTHVKQGQGTKTSSTDSILGVSNIGLNGEYQIDSDYQAFFKLQAGFKPSKGEQSKDGELFDRNAYIGLNSPYGAFSLGKQWSFNDDWFVGSVFKGGYNSGAIFKLSEFDAVSEIYSQTFKYQSPDLNGWKFGIFYATNDDSDKNTHGRIYSGAIKYSTTKMLVGASYEDHAAEDTNNHYKLSTIASRYNFNQWSARLGATYANISGPGQYASIASNLTKQKAWASEIGFDYAATEKLTLSGSFIYKKNTTFDQYTTVYRTLLVYQVRKPLALLANLAYLKNSDGASESLVNTDSGLQGNGYRDQDQLSLALGIRLNF